MVVWPTTVRDKLYTAAFVDILEIGLPASVRASFSSALTIMLCGALQLLERVQKKTLLEKSTGLRRQERR